MTIGVLCADAGGAMRRTNKRAKARREASERDGLWLYRDRTVGLLRRYLRMSVEVGRLPSLLGREFFRSRVTSYRASTFEDGVIFVHDVERSLEELDDFDKGLIAAIVLREFSQKEAARQLRCGYRTVTRHYPESLDRVSEIFLRRGILARFTEERMEAATCQERNASESVVSGSIDGK